MGTFDICILSDTDPSDEPENFMEPNNASHNDYEHEEETKDTDELPSPPGLRRTEIDDHSAYMKHAQDINDMLGKLVRREHNPGRGREGK